jgi:hypothetical protein
MKTEKGGGRGKVVFINKMKTDKERARRKSVHQNKKPLYINKKKLFTT